MIGTAFFILVITEFTIPMFGIVLLIIASVLRFFKNPTWEPIVLICVGGFQAIIDFAITMIFLLAITYAWAYAFELKRKYKASAAKELSRNQ